MFKNHRAVLEPQHSGTGRDFTVRRTLSLEEADAIGPR